MQTEVLECPRKVALKLGLRQLTVHQLIRVLTYKGEMCLDSWSYDEGKFCPLAIGLGLDQTMIDPSHIKVLSELTERGYSVYNTRGIQGTFYRENRAEDLRTAALEVLAEKTSTYVIQEIGFNVYYLINRHSVWSNRVFGNESVRGPKGPLQHLIKEAGECLDNPKDITEYADCLLLIMDASRRAGFQFPDVIMEAIRKQGINETRKWPTNQNPDEPVEHVR